MEIKKTSAEWSKEHPEIIILDPDGWDRENFDYSWSEELITEAEFNRRSVYSTCMLCGPLHPVEDGRGDS